MQSAVTVKKIVIKISSNLLDPDNNKNIIQKICKDVDTLAKKGFEIIIVTSGAVMYGMKALKYTKRPEELPLLQSAASIGQIKLMSNYQNILEKYGLVSAQILVSTDDFRVRRRYLNLRNTVESLLEIGAIPIFNENDSINTEELKFGDNDHLSALITIMMNFDMLVILSDVDGLYDKDPKKNKDAVLIKNIDDISEKHLKLTNSKVSEFSSGGMKTKVEAAIKATKAGINVYIGNGLKASILKVVNKTEVGTYIGSKRSRSNARKKWLGLTPTEQGTIFIDDGAGKALRKNSSLLAIGITNVEGNFNKGSLIEIICNVEKIAQGLTNFSSEEIKLIKGKRTSEFNKYLDNISYKEVVHKNNLYIL